MDAATRQLIEAIHQSSRPCVLALTGGGASAAGLLLSVPGGSRTILEVIVPYHEQALIEFLGHRPAPFCSTETSRARAAPARQRGTELVPGGGVIGLGCTASLATDRPKRGEHRFHLTTHSGQSATTYSLTLNKGARDREGEEAILAATLLNALAEACGLADRLPVALREEDVLQVERTLAPESLTAIVSGDVPVLLVEPDGQVRRDGALPRAVLAGSFNPVHVGHWRLAAVAEKMLGCPVAFELSLVNVDKPALSSEEVRRRVAQFSWQTPVWLTRAPTFLEKSALFPGAVFVIGADTAVRLVDPKYYDGSELHMAEALQQLRQRGARFFVASREDKDGRLQELDALALPAAHRDLFTAIPASEFRVGISSTALRQQTALSGP
jgi:hypothetical protein